MKFRNILIIIFLLCQTSKVLAFYHGVPIVNDGATGHSLIQGGSIYTSSSVNVFKAFTINYRFGANPSIWKIDANGYPTADCTATCTGNILFSSQSAHGMVPGDYYLYYPSTYKTKFNLGGMTNGSQFSGGGASIAGSTVTINSGTSLAGVIKLTLPDQQATLSFNPTFNYTGSTGGMALVAARDKANYDLYVGTGDAREFYSQSFLDYIATGDWSTYRNYGDIGENINNTTWQYRTKKEFISWANTDAMFPTDMWSGGAYTSGNLSYSRVASSGCTAIGGSNELYTALATDATPSPSPQGLLADPTMATKGLSVQAVLPVQPTFSLSAASWSAGTVSVTTSVAHGLPNGITVNATIASSNPSGYNGTQAITVTGASTFTYSKSVDPGAYVSSATYAVNGNTTASPKLCWGTTAFPIYDSASGQSVAINRIVAQPSSASDPPAIFTFVFDPIINSGNGAFIFFNGVNSGNQTGVSGITIHVPYDVQIALVNYLNKNLWFTLPYLATNDFITQVATLARDTMKPALKSKFEACGNEDWNNAFFPTKYSFAIALSMNFSNDVNSWHSLCTRKIMGDIIPTVFSGQMSRVERILAIKAADISTILSNNGTYNDRMISSQLKCGIVTVNGTVGQVYSVYTAGTWPGSCPAGIDYTKQVSAGGNGRAIDVVEAFHNAPYTGATTLYYGADNCSGCTATAAIGTVWQTIMDAYDAGNITLSNSIVDNDIQQGRVAVQNVTCSGSTFTTPLAHGLSISNNVSYEVTGGNNYGNLAPGVMYLVKTVPTSTTFTAVPYVDGTARTTDTAITCGTAATGTVTIGVVGTGASGASGNTISMQYSNNVYHLWGQFLAKQFQSPNETRPSGMSNLIFGQYEGSLEPGGPSLAQCSGLTTSINPTTVVVGTTTATNSPSITNVSTADMQKVIVGMAISDGGVHIPVGATIANVWMDRNEIQLSANATGIASNFNITVTGNCSTSLNLAIYEYKKSTKLRTTQKLQWDQFKGRDPNMPTYNVMINAGDPAQLVLSGVSFNANSSLLNNNQYGLLRGALFGITPVLENYNGMKDFNLN